MRVLCAAMLSSCAVMSSGDTGSNWQAGANGSDDGVRFLPLSVQLNNGVSMPRIGFGTAGLGHSSEEAVRLALMAGYQHIDTAQAQEWYREDAVGRALTQALEESQRQTDEGTPSVPDEQPAREGHEDIARATAERSSDVNGGSACATAVSNLPHISRDDIFVTTKVHPRDFAADRLREMVQTSRETLNGVDLVLLHSPHCWPGSCPESPTPWQLAWRELELLYKEGAVRAIGVSNFSESLLRELLSTAEVMPAVVQNWMDPFNQDKAVRSVCAQNEIAYVAYSTLGGQWTYRSTPSSPNPVGTDATLRNIAEAHGTSPQMVTLSWALQSGVVVLPRSSSQKHIRENLQSFLVPKDDSDGRLGGEEGLGADRKRIYPEGTCGTVLPGDEGAGAVRVATFLTDREIEAIDALDGTIGS